MIFHPGKSPQFSLREVWSFHSFSWHWRGWILEESSLAKVLGSGPKSVPSKVISPVCRILGLIIQRNLTPEDTDVGKWYQRCANSKGKKTPKTWNASALVHLLQDFIWGGGFLVVERIPESEIGCFKKKNIWTPEMASFQWQLLQWLGCSGARTLARPHPRSPLGLVGETAWCVRLLWSWRAAPGTLVGECRRRPPCEEGREKWWEVPVEEPGSQSSCARRG